STTLPRSANSLNSWSMIPLPFGLDHRMAERSASGQQIAHRVVDMLETLQGFLEPFLLAAVQPARLNLVRWRAAGADIHPLLLQNGVEDHAMCFDPGIEIAFGADLQCLESFEARTRRPLGDVIANGENAGGGDDAEQATAL